VSSAALPTQTLAILVISAATVVGVQQDVIQPSSGFALVRDSTLVVLQGRVEIQEPGKGFAQVTRNTRVAVKDSVRTGPDSMAVITYFDGSTTEIEPDTTIQISRLDKRPDGGRDISFRQEAGETWNRVENLSDGTRGFETTTAASVALAHGGSEYRVRLDASKQTVIEAVTDTVVVEALLNGQVVDVPVDPGFRTLMYVGKIVPLVVDPGQSPLGPEPASPAPVSLRIDIDGPVAPWVTDSRNRSVGFQPRTDVYASQIPGARYVVMNGGRQVLDLPDPVDRYTLVLNGRGGGGAYTVTATAIAKGQAADGRSFGLVSVLRNASYTGNAGDGQSHQSVVNVDASSFSTNIGPSSPLPGRPPGSGAYVSGQKGRTNNVLTDSGVLVAMCRPTGNTRGPYDRIGVASDRVQARVALGEFLATGGVCPS
jgi:hypothetical protein